jgi:hypothetical protein
MNSISKKISVFFLLLFSCNLLFAWAETGHRVVGDVATHNIKRKTLKKINKLVNYESLANMGTFGDEIKSDERYKKFYSWHFVNFKDGEKYNAATKNPEGDLIEGINTCIAILKDKKSSKEDQVFYLKMLVHFVGDLHQPLHVGHAEDKGGNDIKVSWFGKSSNLHRVWDGDMIDEWNMSYTELSYNLPYLNKDQKEEIQKGTLLDWVYESQKLASTVYSSVKMDEKLSYKYSYDYLSIAKKQLQKGGLRLAKILDDIYS